MLPSPLRAAGPTTESVTLVGISTSRPLPAGEYRFFFNGMWAGRLICNAYSELERNLDDNFVTVTAPKGVLHEAFFDPALTRSVE